MKSKWFYNNKYWLGAFFLTIIGLICIIISFRLDSKGEDYKLAASTIGGIGTTVLTIGLISFIYELILRNSFLQRTREAVSEVIRESMPARYTNIKDAGIIDAYKGLKIDKLREKFMECKKCRIRILKIWIPNLHTLENSIVDAINRRECSVEIILLDPSCQEAIQKRSLAIPYYEKEDIISNLNLNIAVIKSIWERLQDKSKLTFNLHKSFIGASIIGFGDTIIAGYYLHNRLASEGMLIKVNDVTKGFFHELDEHFETQLKKSEPYDFTSSKGSDKIRAANNVKSGNTT
ncbi:hypothetical protein [Cyclobacterium salsum]|uniref:hypothetical protein n=1 Tax=Cyclobacterium salsum TaxID=2666329 RepID=UPI001391F309|nr:hypothetical protein [Cyclobacterium salsum]